MVLPFFVHGEQGRCEKMEEINNRIKMIDEWR